MRIQNTGPVKCTWCGYAYREFNALFENRHLAVCTVYQTRPADYVREDGKEFLQDAEAPWVFVERIKGEGQN